MTATMMHTEIKTRKLEESMKVVENGMETLTLSRAAIASAADHGSARTSCQVEFPQRGIAAYRAAERMTRSS